VEPQKHTSFLFYFLSIFLILFFAAVIFLITLLSNNKLSFLPADRLVETTVPVNDSIYSSVLNQDSTMTFHFYPATVEKVEMKQFFFRSYILLTLKTLTGVGPLSHTFTIEIPTNLNPNAKDSLQTSDLLKQTNQRIAINIIYSTKKTSYNFFDVVSWNALKLN